MGLVGGILSHKGGKTKGGRAKGGMTGVGWVDQIGEGKDSGWG